MAIKTQYESAEEIPEYLRDHSVEVDGKFIIEVDDVETHPKVVKLKNAYTREKEKRDGQKQTIADLQVKLDAIQVKLDAIPEDYDPERWTELKLMETKAIDPEKQKEAIKKELETQRQNVKADLERAWEVEKQQYEKENTVLKDFLEKTIKQDRLREGLVAAGVAKEFLAGAMALLHPRVKIVQDEGNFKDVVETDMGDINAKDYAAKWVTQDEGKPYVKAATGPDLKPGPNNKGVPTVGNPWEQAKPNLTEQTKLLSKLSPTYDPQKAERLKRAAGIKE